MEIITDSRENHPYWTDNVQKLDVGDYTIKGHQHRISIERKSLADLFQTLGKGHKRFKQELKRSESLDYFAIVIDGTYTQALKKYFPHSHYTQMKGEVIIKILFTLHIKYGINIFFCDGRAEAKKLVKSIFEAYLRNSGSI